MNKELIEILKYLGQMEIGKDAIACFQWRMTAIGTDWCDGVSCNNCPLSLRINENRYSRLILTIPVGSL